MSHGIDVYFGMTKYAKKKEPGVHARRETIGETG
jgi:hypothetical protein